MTLKTAGIILKPKLFIEGTWHNCEDVECAPLKWVDWFNKQRLLEPIGNIPPIEAEEKYYAALDKNKLAA